MNETMHENILQWLQTSAQQLRTSLQQEFAVEQKTSARDLVTEMDHQIENYLVKNIQNNYPSHQIVGEEGTETENLQMNDGYVWLIDPIDGTMNFVKQKDNFAIIIGIFKDGQPLAGYIYDVMRDRLCAGVVGDGVYLNDLPLIPITISDIRESLISGNISMFAHDKHPNCQNLLDYSLGGRYNGSAALSILDLLMGKTGVYLSQGLEPWDLGAGKILAGILEFPMTRPDGSEVNIFERGPVIFCHPSIHQQVIQILKTGELNE